MPFKMNCLMLQKVKIVEIILISEYCYVHYSNWMVLTYFIENYLDSNNIPFQFFRRNSEGGMLLVQ